MGLLSQPWPLVHQSNLQANNTPKNHMNTSSSGLAQEVVPWRKFLTICFATIANKFSANLARAGHSVFLIEAGEDHGDSLLQRVPAM